MSKSLTFSQVMPFVIADLKSNKVPTFLSEPGIGKSSCLNAIADKIGTKVFTLAMNQLSGREDLIGLRTKELDNGEFQQVTFPHITLSDAIAYANEHPNETPIIFLDEFNRAPVDVVSAVLTFITDRKVGATAFPDNIRFVVAGNDKGNISSIDEASVSRLAIYPVAPDMSTFLNVNPTLNTYIRKALQAHPHLLVCRRLDTAGDVVEDDDDKVDEMSMSLFGEDESQFQQFTTPRTISNTSDWLNNLGVDGTGSQLELQTVSQFITLTPVPGANGKVEDSLLLKGLIAHMGETELTQHVYDEIIDAYSQSVSTQSIPQQAQQATSFEHFRPSSAFIATLKGATTVDDLRVIMQNPTTDLDELLLWLLTEDAFAVIGNVNLASALLDLTLEKVGSVSNQLNAKLTQGAPSTKFNATMVQALSGRVNQNVVANNVHGLVSYFI